MRKKLTILAASVFILALFTKCEEFKYRINHKGKIIEVSVNAWAAHEAHGDTRITTIYKLDDGSLWEPGDAYPVGGF
jgi:hypothetical protein